MEATDDNQIPSAGGAENHEQGFLMFVADNSGIKPDDLEKLFYNGFDNSESFAMVTVEQLDQLDV